MQLPLLSNTRRQPRRRSGATVVEFALCAPLLFLLVFGLIEMSPAVFHRQCLYARCHGGRSPGGDCRLNGYGGQRQSRGDA